MSDLPPFPSFGADNWQVMPFSRIPPDANRSSAWLDLHMSEFRHDRWQNFYHGPHRRRFEPVATRFYFWTTR